MEEVEIKQVADVKYRSSIFLLLENGLQFSSSDMLIQWGAGEYKFNPSFKNKYITLDSLQNCTLYIPYATFNTVEQALVLTEFLGKMGVNIKDTLIGYVSYSRQDRETDTEPQLCHFIITLIGLLKNPVVIDMHNEKSLDLFKIRKVSAAPLFYEIAKSLDKNAIIIAPDKGAANRLKEYGVPVDGYLKKTRYEYEVVTEIDEEIANNLKEKVLNVIKLGKTPNYFIIDDICDGGRTFIEAARVLDSIIENDFLNGLSGEELKQVIKTLYPKVYLMVSHAILPFGVEDLRRRINKIFTLPTAQVIYDDYITILNLNHIQNKLLKRDV